MSESTTILAQTEVIPNGGMQILVSDPAQPPGLRNARISVSALVAMAGSGGSGGSATVNVGPGLEVNSGGQIVPQFGITSGTVADGGVQQGLVTSLTAETAARSAGDAANAAALAVTNGGVATNSAGISGLTTSLAETNSALNVVSSGGTANAAAIAAETMARSAGDAANAAAIAVTNGGVATNSAGISGLTTSLAATNSALNVVSSGGTANAAAIAAETARAEAAEAGISAAAQPKIAAGSGYLLGPPAALGGMLAQIALAASLVIADSTIGVAFGSAAGLAAQGNDARITGALQGTNNLSDLTSVSAAQGHLGLGSIATQAAGAVAITGGTIAASVSSATALSSYTGSTTAMTLAARAGLLPAVQDYGLAMNGTTDDSAAWNAMETALPTGSTILVTGSIHAPSYAPNTTKAFLYDFVGPVSGGTVMTGFDQVGSTVQFLGDGATVNNFVSSGHQAGVQFNRQNISSNNYASVVGVHQYANNTNTGTATTFIASGVTGPNNGGSLYVSGAYLNSYGTSPSGGGSIAHTVYVNKYYGSTENLWGEWLHFTDLSGFGSIAGLGGSYASERDFTPNGFGLPNSSFVDNDSERKHMLLKVHSHLTSVWAAGATVKAGANYTASSSANPFFGYLVTCTTAGTTGSTEPTWPSLPYPGTPQIITEPSGLQWTWNGTIVAGTVETILQLACDTSNGIQSGQMTVPANTARHILIKGQNYGAGIDFTPFVPIASPNADGSAAFNVAAIRLAYNVLDFGGNGTLNGMNNLVLAGNSSTGNLELRSGTGNVAPTVQSILQKNGGATFNNTVTVTAGGLVISANGLQVNGGVTQIGSAGATIAGGGLQINGGGLSGLTASFSGNLTANTLTANAGLTVTAGGITISGGTLNGSVGSFTNGFSVGTLTATAGGVNVTAGGVAITAGGLQVNGGVITGSAASLTGNLTANTLTASAGLTVTAGGITISAGALNAGVGAFSGAVTGLTAAANDNSTKLATTAFYAGQAASVAPLGDAASAAVGTSLLFARQDHVHGIVSPAYSQSFLTNGTATIPTWAKLFRIVGTGGAMSGAGGGTVASSGSGGGGGGSAAYLDTGWLPVANLSTRTGNVVIGAGGAVAAAGAVANTGANSTVTFGSTVYTFGGANNQTNATAGSSVALSIGGTGGGNYITATAQNTLNNGNFGAQGGFGCSSVGVPASSGIGGGSLLGVGSGGAGGGLNAGTFQAGGNSGIVFVYGISNYVGGGATAGTNGTAGVSNTNWPFVTSGAVQSGGGGGAGNGAGVGGNGGAGGQPGCGGGGGGSGTGGGGTGGAGGNGAIYIQAV